MPNGLYLISADAVKELETHPSHDVIVHATDRLNEQCNTDDIKHKSYFNDLNWAVGRGYKLCGHCLSTVSCRNCGQPIEFGTGLSAGDRGWYHVSDAPGDHRYCVVADFRPVAQP